MLQIDPKNRDDLKVFREQLYTHLRNNKLRYSDQRERVLKMLYMQSSPLNIEILTRKLNENMPKAASYPTVARHINFFNKLGWLIVINKIHKQYLLKERIPKIEEI
ncbi:MAG: hypothetical protein U9R50_01710 [Campylobacterota bacterium]|nr:hypothetical protein [Campylobacterota bacterium]